MDFYCAALKLAVEVDGYTHCINDRPERDAARDRWLLSQGLRTLRIPAGDVLESVEGALGQIRSFIAANQPQPPPPPFGGPPPPEGEESYFYWRS